MKTLTDLLALVAAETNANTPTKVRNEFVIDLCRWSFTFVQIDPQDDAEHQPDHGSFAVGTVRKWDFDISNPDGVHEAWGAVARYGRTYR